MIRAIDLSLRVPGAPGQALEGLSFSIEPGEAVAVVGPRGAGKSSLLRLLAGFIPDWAPGEWTGTLDLDGRSLRSLTPRERISCLGMVFSDPLSQLSGLCATVAEEVAWGPGNLGLPREVLRSRVESCLGKVGLGGVAERSPFALSGGQQQRLALASVLALEPRVLLLDEPVSMLDPEGRGAILELATEQARAGRIVLWATSQLEEAARFPRWIRLEGGRLVGDGPAAIDPGHGCLEAPWTRLARRAASRGAFLGAWPVLEEDAVRGLRP